MLYAYIYIERERDRERYYMQVDSSSPQISEVFVWLDFTAWVLNDMFLKSRRLSAQAVQTRLWWRAPSHDLYTVAYQVYIYIYIYT